MWGVWLGFPTPPLIDWALLVIPCRVVAPLEADILFDVISEIDVISLVSFCDG